MLDSTLYDATFAGHTLVGIEFKENTELNVNAYGTSIQGAELINALCAEVILSKIINKEFKDFYEQLDIAIIATLNQIADNPALIADLGVAEGENIPEIIKKLLAENKLYVSLFPGVITDDNNHDILTYIIESIITALARIMKPSSPEEESTAFASSLFNKLGYSEYSSRQRNEKIKLILGSFYEACHSEINEICGSSSNEKEFVKKIYELICNNLEKTLFDEKQEKMGNTIVYRGKKDQTLGCLTALFLYSDNFGKKIIFDNIEMYDQSRINTFDSLKIFDSLASINISMKKIKNNMTNEDFILNYKYTGTDVKFKITDGDNIFTRGLKAMLNNEELFKIKMEMFYPIISSSNNFRDNDLREKVNEDVNKVVYKILSTLLNNVNGGRSKFIDKLDKDIEIEQFIENTSVLKKIYQTEQIKHEKLRKNNPNYKGPTFSLKNKIRYIIREVINCSYNICYCLLTTPDKRIFEADGVLVNFSNRPLWKITAVYDRKYDIENGKLIIKEEKKILC